MIFYCPQCNKLDMDFRISLDIPQVVNIRDGYGHPLYHVKCECGNCLSAGIHYTKEEVESDLGLLDYIKEIITNYNKGGYFYTDGDYECIEENINKREQQIKEAMEERNRIFNMSDSERREHFKNKFEEMKRNNL